MNYQNIHDAIINRALSRKKEENTYYENHHVIPKCEGGDDLGQLVSLTLKEHRLVHYLRYKITKVLGNIYAYNCMIHNETTRRLNFSIASKMSHNKFKSRDPIGYENRQSRAGTSGGNKCAREKLGFHSLPEEIMYGHRMKGTKILMEKKLGIFSAEFIEQNRQRLFKKVHTPEGTFESMMAAADHHKCVAASVTYRVNSKSDRFKEWYLI